MLAAGSSRRFGRGVKLLAPMRGQPLLHHAIERAHESGARRVLVVTGAARGRIERAVRWAGERSVFAIDHRLGVGASLRAALRAVLPIEREVVIFLGDMPFVGSARRWRLRPGIDAVRPSFQAQPGHPLLVRTCVARALVKARDDGIGGALPKDRLTLVRGTAGAIRDIDDRASLRRVRWTTPHR